jgi:hypothetical protein
VSSSRSDVAQVETAPEQAELTAGDDTIFEAPAVLKIVWADPQHMAEHLAVWSLARFGRRAGSVVERLRVQSPDATHGELEQLVIQRQARIAMTEGAFVGGPFIVLMSVAFCAALLAQAQMVFQLAAVFGRDPTDRLRAAELLVLLGAYESTAEAAGALAALPPHSKARTDKRLPRGSRMQMIKRMAYMLEVVSPADETRSRLRSALGWTGIGVLFLVGIVLPLVWVPYMAYSSRRITLRVGRRARTYYEATEAGEAGVTVRRGEHVDVGGTVAFVRVSLLVMFPIIVALVALLTNFSFAGGRWLTAGLLLLAISALATLAWFGYRWWRHRHRRLQ